MRRSILAVLTGVAALLGLIAGPGTVVARAATVKPAAVSLSCRQQTAGVHQLTMKVGSKTRSYVVYAPAKWSAARKTAVLYILHGQYGQALGTIEGTKTRYQADKDGFLLVAPQGEGGANSNWDYTSGTGVDGSDANFLLQLPALIATNWCIDPARQYIAGYSAGSAVTHVMACYGGFPFAGYAGAAAQNWNSGCTNPKPFDFLYFHGTADPYVPFQGNAQINSVAAPPTAWPRSTTARAVRRPRGSAPTSSSTTSLPAPAACGCATTSCRAAATSGPGPTRTPSWGPTPPPSRPIR